MKSVVERIEALDDKDALNVVNNLTSAVMAHIHIVQTAADLPDLLDPVARDAGLSLKGLDTTWLEACVDTRYAGDVARASLRALANDEQGADFVSAGIEEFPSDDLDFGALSVPIAAGMFYIAVVSELDIDLGWFKLKKKGLTAEQQVELGKKLLPEIFKGFLKASTG